MCGVVQNTAQNTDNHLVFQTIITETCNCLQQGLAYSLPGNVYSLVHQPPS